MSLSLAPAYTQRNYTWINWKSIQISKNGNYQYDDDEIIYTIYFYDGPEVHSCIIWKNIVPDIITNNQYSQAQNDIDKIDFEDNFKSKANKSIVFPNKEIYSITGITTSVNSSISSVTLLSTNINRLGATIFNDSILGNLFIKLGVTASTTSFTVKLMPNGYYEIPFGYVGQIDGVWNEVSGLARITEII